jgi:hypothetical protein
VFVSGGLSDRRSDPRGQFLALVAARPVHNLLGAEDPGLTEFPPLGKPVVEEGLGYQHDTGGHPILPADWRAFRDFADRHSRPRGSPRPAIRLNR